MQLAFDNSFARDLPGFYVSWPPQRVPAPRLLYFNHALAGELGMAPARRGTEALAAMLSGNQLPEGAQPIAQAYAGHQFGQFSPRLGDGRALLLGEIIDRQGRRRDIAFKGSGPTPFARGGDGKAAVGPMLREVLIGEAMHALGIATTRALAVVATGEAVRREAVLPGATLTRVAGSHLRVGSFEYYAARGETGRVRQLADYAIARHFPAVRESPTPYTDFLRAVQEAQAALVAQWMGVGFIHGVMNTDNMSIGGETIDFGPCAFMETYDPKAVFSSIDRQGRYAYGNQPGIANWNLARLAESLLPLIDDDVDAAVERATDVLAGFGAAYGRCWLGVMRAKLGLHDAGAGDSARDDEDIALAESWLGLLHAQRVDFTLAWRRLADAAQGNAAPLFALFGEPAALEPWLAGWQARCAAEGAPAGAGPAAAGVARAGAMRRCNPWLIPRNHRVEEALAAASEAGDLAPFERLLAALESPWEEDAANADLAQPAAASFTAGYRTFCGT